MELPLLVVAFVVILLGAELFTNGIEWFGHKLNLSEGAIGSVLAAVRGPGSSPHYLGLDGSLRLVDGLIGQACDDAGIRSTTRQIAEFGAWFMAGADLPAEERALHRAIEVQRERSESALRAPERQAREEQGVTRPKVARPQEIDRTAA